MHAYYDLGQYSEALRCYDVALRIDPRHGSAKFQREETLKQIERLRGRS
ncbi:MAG: tetratricopeptide repeat protein [Candidatus Obscuribacterales bacterium]|nr:tetratricopeptide repeat protein [Candidatus Obscuribacterales bacterium]